MRFTAAIACTLLAPSCCALRLVSSGRRPSAQPASVRCATPSMQQGSEDGANEANSFDGSFGEAFPDFSNVDQEALWLALESQERDAAAAAAAEVAAAWRELDESLVTLLGSLAQVPLESAAPLSTSDFASVEDLKAAMATTRDDHSVTARTTAARYLISQRKAIVEDATADVEVSAGGLRRFDEDDVPQIESALREGARRLLGSAGPLGDDDTYVDGPGDAALVARASKYISRRVCAPRDIDAEAAIALRCVLLDMAREAEAYAWSLSGGLL